VVRYTPSFIDPSEPHKSAVRVRIPDDEGLPLKGELLREHLEQGNQRTIHLLRLDFNRTYDIAEVSLVTTGTLNGLSGLVRRPLEPLRFKPNILIETFPHLGAYPENDWVGKMLVLGAEADATSDAKPLGGKRRVGDGGAGLSPISNTERQGLTALAFLFTAVDPPTQTILREQPRTPRTSRGCGRYERACPRRWRWSRAPESHHR
jgi:hypothetical protein